MSATTLLFDIGNVLVTFDFSRASRRVAEKSRFDADTVLKVVSDIKDELEGGRMDEDAFFALAMERIGYSGTREELEHAWCDIFAINEPMLQTLRGLPGGVRLLLLSNTNGPHKRWLLQQYPEIFERFEGGVFSHEARCMKPHDEIYRRVLEDFQLEPEKTFYIDDLLANIEAGRRWGLHSFHYDPSDHGALAKALSSWLGA